MAKQATGVFLPNLKKGMDATDVPLYRQIYARAREAILEGRLVAGSRLPSTRTLAADLGVSRTTVELAFTELEAEGYLVRRVGAGSFVASCLPERPATPASRETAIGIFRRQSASGALSARGRVIAGTSIGAETTTSRGFTPCLPDREAFPIALWNRLIARRTRLSGSDLLGYGEAAGFRPLREAVAAYLGTGRGVKCHWRQVVMVTSTQQALDLIARLLLDPGDTVWLEEPGYLGARAAFQNAGAHIVPVPVDGDGLNVATGIARAPAARLVYVTPSHQYPVGVTLSLSQRLALLDWAEQAEAWIFEDDYDSEFRYAGRPLAAMQGLDRAGRVLYVGTFNKVMFPSLRLAYLVVPEDLVDSCVTARVLTDGHLPLLTQAVLADFIQEDHFGAYLRKIRLLYRERRDALLNAMTQEFGDYIRVPPSDTGLHITGWLPDEADDQAISHGAMAQGLDVPPLSRYYLGELRRAGLVFGYSGMSAAAIQQGIRALASVMLLTR